MKKIVLTLVIILQLCYSFAETGVIIESQIKRYMDDYSTGFILETIKSKSHLIDEVINDREKTLQLQKDNIGFRYGQIQSILGWLAIVAFVLFGISYVYIYQQAKKTIQQIKNQKNILEKEYNKLIKITTEDIQNIKDDNEFTAILVQGNKLNSLGLYDDAIDFYNDQLDKGFIAKSNGRKYSIYKQLTDIYYTRGEKSERIFENIDKYDNALQRLQKAMLIYSDREEDITYKSTIQGKIDDLSHLTPSEK